ncbi:MAG: ribonuclease HII [bacterium]|nr:ribonuclease HII [bacterium]
MNGFLVGVDEAGRGPLAGPVAVAVFSIAKSEKHLLLGFFQDGKIRDSKKMTAVSREVIFRDMAAQKKLGKVSYAVSFASSLVIDRKGISFAIRRALARSLTVINVKPSQCRVLLDGSLRAPKEFVSQRTIIKGDEKEAVIALASIVAKVSRDRLMRRLAKKYPHYDLDIHKGYGTKAHYKKLKKYGLSPVHRKSFLKGFAASQY